MFIFDIICVCSIYDSHHLLFNFYKDVIDLIDFDGVLREVPNGNNKDYAIQYLVPTGNYAVIRVETDQATNEKRYSAMLSDKGLNHNMQSKTNCLA